MHLCTLWYSSNVTYLAITAFYDMPLPESYLHTAVIYTNQIAHLTATVTSNCWSSETVKKWVIGRSNLTSHNKGSLNRLGYLPSFLQCKRKHHLPSRESTGTSPGKAGPSTPPPSFPWIWKHPRCESPKALGADSKRATARAKRQKKEKVFRNKNKVIFMQ